MSFKGTGFIPTFPAEHQQDYLTAVATRFHSYNWTLQSRCNQIPPPFFNLFFVWCCVYPGKSTAKKHAFFVPMSTLVRIGAKGGWVDGRNQDGTFWLFDWGVSWNDAELKALAVSLPRFIFRICPESLLQQALSTDQSTWRIL